MDLPGVDTVLCAELVDVVRKVTHGVEIYTWLQRIRMTSGPRWPISSSGLHGLVDDRFCQHGAQTLLNGDDDDVVNWPTFWIKSFRYLGYSVLPEDRIQLINLYRCSGEMPVLARNPSNGERLRCPSYWGYITDITVKDDGTEVHTERPYASFYLVFTRKLRRDQVPEVTAYDFSTQSREQLVRVPAGINRLKMGG